jgi:hypothetical protein
MKGCGLSISRDDLAFAREIFCQMAVGKMDYPGATADLKKFLKMVQNLRLVHPHVSLRPERLRLKY